MAVNTVAANAAPRRLESFRNPPVRLVDTPYSGTWHLGNGASGVVENCRLGAPKTKVKILLKQDFNEESVPIAWLRERLFDAVAFQFLRDVAGPEATQQLRPGRKERDRFFSGERGQVTLDELSNWGSK
jgi:hypothetical protein